MKGRVDLPTLLADPADDTEVREGTASSRDDQCPVSWREAAMRAQFERVAPGETIPPLTARPGPFPFRACQNCDVSAKPFADICDACGGPVLPLCPSCGELVTERRVAW